MLDLRIRNRPSHWLRAVLLLTGLFTPLVHACTAPCDGTLDDWLPGWALKTAEQNVANGTLLMPQDGTLLVVGTCGVGTSMSVCVAKFNPDGTPATSFGSGGRILLSDLPGALHGVLNVLVGRGSYLLPGANPRAALAPDGDIVIGAANDFHDWVVRLSANGTTIDSIIEDPLDNSILQAVLVRHDGKVVLMGNGFPGYPDDITVARYLADLSQRDPSFGNAGVSRLDAPAGTSDTYLRSIVETPDHALVFAGQTWPTGASSSAGYLARLTANGWYDSGFDGDGRMIDTYASSYVDLGANRLGEVWAAGTSVTTPTDIRVLRVLSNATLLGARNYDGGCTNADDHASRITIQPDGKVLVAGYCGLSNGSASIGLLRLTTTDNLDTSFGESGFRWFTFVHTNRYDPVFVDSIRVGAGGIILSWHSFFQNEDPHWLSRFTLDEIFPATFDN